MLEVFELVTTATTQSPTTKGETLSVVLTFEERKKSRHKTTTECGKEFGWFLERGIVLTDGDVLKTKTAELIKVIAAKESVSEVHSDSAHALMRAAYHLGNRHVPLQVEPKLLRYQHDHVLDDMVRGLGLKVAPAQSPFQPENGAYSGGNSHSHSHHH